MVCITLLLYFVNHVLVRVCTIIIHAGVHATFIVLVYGINMFIPHAGVYNMMVHLSLWYQCTSLYIELFISTDMREYMHAALHLIDIISTSKASPVANYSHVNLPKCSHSLFYQPRPLLSIILVRPWAEWPEYFLHP